MRDVSSKPIRHVLFRRDPIRETLDSPIELPDAELLEFEVDPGAYCLVSSQSGVGWSEFTLEEWANRRTGEYRIWVRDLSRRSALRAIDVDPGTLPIRRSLTDAIGVIQEHRVEYPVRAVEACVDQATNALFERYCDECEVAVPPMWNRPRPDRWNDRPIAFISQQTMRSFANWAGMRLPTLAEWHWMVRGPTQDPFPWPVSDGDRWESLNLDRIPYAANADRTTGGSQSPWDWYCEVTEPVGTRDAARSKTGLNDTLGGLTDWTDSIPFNLVSERFVPSETQHYEAGASCTLTRLELRRKGYGFYAWSESFIPRCDVSARFVRTAVEPI